MEKTTQELLQECDYKIARLEKQIEVVNNQLMIDNSLLDRLKEQRKNYLNFLNTDEC